MKTKNIFGSLIFILFLVLVTTKVKSQGTTHTPMGQTVYLENNWDTPYLIADAEAWAAQWITNNNSDAIRIAPATSNYNCHSYAWNVTEGGPSTNAWIDQTWNGNPNVSKYWTNDGYTSTSTVANHEKIFYGTTANHSAITTATSGKVRSKWGVCGLYEHSTAQCPYNSGNLQYYKLVNPTISGSSVALCEDYQRTFSESSFTNISLNYDWSTSSPLTEIGGDGTSSYTVAGTSQNGSGTIYLTITTPSGASSTSSKDVWVGEPHELELYCEGRGDLYTYAFYVTPFYDGDSIVWGVYPNPAELTDLGYGYATIRFDEPGIYDIWAYVENECGDGTPAYIYDFYVYELLMSPNPASTEVEITISAGPEEGMKSANLSSDDEYTVTILDNYGVAKIQKKYFGKKFTVPVNSLKDGNYFVKINNGKMNATKQLIIKR